VQFNIEKVYHGESVLTIAIAGQTSDPRLDILLNNTPIGSISAGNSSAAYRSAILSSSYYETRTVRFPISLLKSGANTLTLRLKHGSIMYDCLMLDVDQTE
jgi:rhamnogalacturonan endolyase